MCNQRLKLMWNGEYVGNVSPDHCDQPDFYGEFELVTANNMIVQYLWLRNTDDNTEQTRTFGKLEHEFLKSIPFGWRLVCDDGASVDLAIPPFVDIETGRICWHEIFDDSDANCHDDKYVRVIRFYSTKDPYGEFSNFAHYPITINGKIWPTSEHFFQGQKFAGTKHEELVRLEPSPMKAAKMGRDRNRPLRSDWESVKDDVMRTAVYAKFKQHESLQRLLVGTGRATLVEHTRNDSYWGDGGDGSGKNMLGIILMRLREVFRAEQHC